MLVTPPDIVTAAPPSPSPAARSGGRLLQQLLLIILVAVLCRDNLAAEALAVRNLPAASEKQEVIRAPEDDAVAVAVTGAPEAEGAAAAPVTSAAEEATTESEYLDLSNEIPVGEEPTKASSAAATEAEISPLVVQHGVEAISSEVSPPLPPSSSSSKAVPLLSSGGGGGAPVQSSGNDTCSECNCDQDASSSSETSSTSEVCLTEDCVMAAATILSSLDKSVDPCEDFYQARLRNIRLRNIY